MTRESSKSLRGLFVRRENNPRDDLVVTFVLMAFVLAVAVVPYIVYRGDFFPPNLQLVEILDLFLGPILIAGGAGICLEDMFASKRKNH